jgi:hypothetical protein
MPLIGLRPRQRATRVSGRGIRQRLPNSKSRWWSVLAKADLRDFTPKSRSVNVTIWQDHGVSALPLLPTECRIPVPPFARAAERRSSEALRGENEQPWVASSRSQAFFWRSSWWGCCRFRARTTGRARSDFRTLPCRNALQRGRAGNRHAAVPVQALLLSQLPPPVVGARKGHQTATEVVQAVARPRTHVRGFGKFRRHSAHWMTASRFVEKCYSKSVTMPQRGDPIRFINPS